MKRYLLFFLVIIGSFGLGMTIGTFNNNYNEPSLQLRFPISMDPMSFEKSIWQIMNELIQMDDNLPKKYLTYDVELQNSVDEQNGIHLRVDRDDLKKLNAGDVKPEIFLRRYVAFF